MTKGVRNTGVIRLLVVSLAVVGMLAFASPRAGAETINMDWKSGGEVYHNLGTGLAGEFQTVSDLLGGDWIGYCIDPAQWAGSQYEVVTDIASWRLPYSNPIQTTGAALNAAWLIEQYAPGLDMLEGESVNYKNGKVKRNINALQMAIWEVVMDPAGEEGYDLNGGAFFLWHGKHNRWGSSYGKKTIDLAQTYLDALVLAQNSESGLELSGAYEFVIAQSDTKQDILLARPGQGAETPEPGTMLLFASALGAGAWVRRRKLKKA